MKCSVTHNVLKRCNRLFHSSRVKLPFVNTSASWFLDSTYLIWIFGSKLILSNNQPNATLWVLDTWLIVGLLPLMTIFITASLSSKMYNCDSFSDRCAFAETWSTFDRSTFRLNIWPILGVLFGGKQWFPDCRLPSIRKPASSDIISDSVELCDTEVCFLHIQLIGTSVLLPNMHKAPPDVDLESSRSSAKSESWNSLNRQWCAVLSTWQYWR